jgi:hypothetical protein
MRFPSVMLGSRPEYTWEATPLVIKGRFYTTASLVNATLLARRVLPRAF